MTQKLSQEYDDALGKAKRGLLILDIAVRDRIMQRQVNFMPPAFMNANIHNGADALRSQFFRPAARLAPKKDNSDASMFAAATMQQDVALRWHHVPCRPTWDAPHLH